MNRRDKNITSGVLAVTAALSANPVSAAPPARSPAGGAVAQTSGLAAPQAPETDAQLFTAFVAEYFPLFHPAEAPKSWDAVWHKMLKDPHSSKDAHSSVFKHFNPEIASIIMGVAIKEHVDPQLLAKIALVESSGNPNDVNKDTDATGLFQFTAPMAKMFKLDDRLNPVESCNAAIGLLRENKENLVRHLKRLPSSAEMYLAHQQGLPAALALIGAADKEQALMHTYKLEMLALSTSPDPLQAETKMPKPPHIATAAELLSGLNISYAKQHITENGGKADWTALQFVMHWQEVYDAIGENFHVKSKDAAVAGKWRARLESDHAGPEHHRHGKHSR